MKILIVTAWYAPFIHPRAHRWTALATHWAGEGHEVHVLTARVRESSQNEVLQGVQIHRVGFDSLKEWVYYWLGSSGARGRVGVKPGKSGLFSRLLAWFYNAVWKQLFFPDDACVWYFPAKRKLRQLLENERFDALITVSLPFTGHLLGLSTFRKFQTFGKLKPIWLADIGDPFSFQAKPPNNAFLYQKKNRRLERQVLEGADVVTVTTEAARRKYLEQFGEKAIAKMIVVPPLLTSPPTFALCAMAGKQSTNHPSFALCAMAGKQSTNPPITNPPITPPSRFALWRASNPPITNPPITKMGYFGALYAPTRTPDAFLDLLAQTKALRPDLYKRLEVHFYGEIFPEFFEKLHAEPVTQLHGLCSRIEVWKAMQEMDILLNIGNTTDFQLPSKAVDYLAVGKPVLNLSFVENDPFAEFFKGNPLVFNLIVENGSVSNVEWERWLEWLESEKPRWSEAEIEARIAPFLLENIANQYFTNLNK